MSRKRNRDEITPTPAPVKDLQDNKELLIMVKKMIRRLEENKEDVDKILEPTGKNDSAVSKTKQREIITDADVKNVLQSIKTIIGDLVHLGQVDVDDSQPNVREFTMQIMTPLALTDKDLTNLKDIPDVATITIEQNTVNEMILSLTYTKNRKRLMMYKQQQSRTATDIPDALVGEPARKKPFQQPSSTPSPAVLAAEQHNHNTQRNNINSELILLLDNSFNLDLDDESDLQVQSKCNKNDTVDLVFSLSVFGRVRHDQIASVATHPMIDYIKIYPGTDKPQLRLQVGTFKLIDQPPVQPLHVLQSSVDSP